MFSVLQRETFFFLRFIICNFLHGYNFIYFACRGDETFFSWCWMLEPVKSLCLWSTLTPWTTLMNSTTGTSKLSRRPRIRTIAVFTRRSHTLGVLRKRWWPKMRSWGKRLSSSWPATKPAATRWPSPATSWPSTPNVNAKYRRKWMSSLPDMWVYLICFIWLRHDSCGLLWVNCVPPVVVGVTKLHKCPGAEIFGHGYMWSIAPLPSWIQVKEDVKWG